MGDPAIHYEVHGRGDPLMLVSGLAGVGRGWGEQIDRFSTEFATIVPDHPGTGSSPLPADGFTIEGHAAAMADAIREIGCGPTHIVGSSTGGAVAQVLALDHPDVVRSIVLASSWARSDDHFRHQFAVRKAILTEMGSEAYARATALFLFSPGFFRHHYPDVDAWCRRASSGNAHVMAARIDMILAHDILDRLGEVASPTLVLVGSEDACTPPHLSHELAAAIPGAEEVMLDGGHLIYKEDPAGFHAAVRRFVLAV